MGFAPAADAAALAVTGSGAWPDGGLSVSAAVGPCTMETAVEVVADAPEPSATVTETV